MWYYSKEDQSRGPVPLEELVGMLRGGSLTGESLTWREGMDDWLPVGQVPEVQQALVQSRLVPGAVMPSGAAMPSGVAMPVVPQQNGMALTSMVLGIISVVLGTLLLTAIPGVICGHIARRQMRESPYPQGGAGMATAGLILGYLSIILTVMMILAFAGIFFFAYKASGLP